MLMDIILIQAEVHIKMILYLWRSPPDTDAEGEEELKWRMEIVLGHNERAKIHSALKFGHLKI